MGADKQAQTQPQATQEQAIAFDIAGNRVLAEARTFKTGSRGYWAGGKLVIGTKRYQASISLVEIGSKPAGK